jgi:hypothetical protein
MEYTSSFLLQFMLEEHHLRHGISRRGQEVSLSVTSSTSTQTKYCRLRRNHSGKAEIFIGWLYAIRAFKLKEGDICMFSFKDVRHLPSSQRDDSAWLKMHILRLEVH